MSTALEQWKAQLNALSPGERTELAYYLLSTLEPADEAAEAAREAEASRRVREIREGRVVGRSADVLLDELRECYS